MRPVPVLLGLGANLGDPVRQLRTAVERLGEIMTLDAVSAVYRTEPVGVGPQPDYYNLACRGRTSLSPLDLLRALLRLEAELGRERPAPGAARTLDIDLLAYGDQVMETPELVLPHPRLHERAFVLTPLREVAPGWRHPLLHFTVEELLPGAAGRVERWGTLGARG